MACYKISDWCVCVTGKMDRGEKDTAWGMGFKWPWQKDGKDKQAAKK